LLSNRKGGKQHEATARKQLFGQTHKDVEFFLLGERQTTLQENWHGEPVSYEGISMAGS
jgi:hypothetical protein